jgi:hypothetical protein
MIKRLAQQQGEPHAFSFPANKCLIASRIDNFLGQINIDTFWHHNLVQVMEGFWDFRRYHPMGRNQGEVAQSLEM